MLLAQQSWGELLDPLGNVRSFAGVLLLGAVVGHFGVPAEDGGEDVRDLHKLNVVGLHREGVSTDVQSGRLLLAVVVVIGPDRWVEDQVCDVGEAALVLVEHEHGAVLVPRLGLVGSLELQCDVACAGQPDVIWHRGARRTRRVRLVLDGSEGKISSATSCSNAAPACETPSRSRQQ